MKKKLVLMTLMILMSFSFVFADSDYPFVQIGADDDSVVEITVNESNNYFGNLSFDAWNLSDSGWLYNNSGDLDWNVTKGDARYQDEIGVDCGAGDYVYGVNDDGSLDCSTPAGGGAEGWNITGSVYLINDSGILDVNETKLNESIVDASPPTNPDNIWLYVESDTMYFNETKVNASFYYKTEIDTQGEMETIWGVTLATDTELAGQDECSEITGCVTDAWDDNADLSANEISESKIDFDTVCGAGNHLYVSGNDLACEPDDDTTYTADGLYLYLSGTVFNFNETFLNDTIDARSTNDTDTDTHVEGDGVYLTNDSTTMFFNDSLMNQTIDDRTASTTYLPVNVSVDGGTIDAGDNDSLVVVDDDYLNVSEGSGSPPVLDVYMNFTDVEDFNSMLFHVQYNGSVLHELHIALWDYEVDEWEEEYGEILHSDDLEFVVKNVYDAGSHIGTGENDSLVQMRLRHDENGNAGHDLYLDYVALIEGYSTTVTTEHDALDGRDNSGNHPWAFPTDASRNITGNVTVNANVTADYYFGDATYLVNQVGFWSLSAGYLYNNSGNLDFNETFLNETIDARSINATLTQEEVEDYAGGMATGGDGVDFAYDDGAGTLTPSFDCSDVVGTGLSCSGEDLGLTNDFGASIDDTELTAEDFGEFTCDGSEDGCTLNDDALDDQYFDSEADLTGLLDDNYVDVTGDEMTGNLNMTDQNITSNWRDITNVNESCTIIYGSTSRIELC